MGRERKQKSQTKTFAQTKIIISIQRSAQTLTVRQSPKYSQNHFQIKISNLLWCNILYSAGNVGECVLAISTVPHHLQYQLVFFSETRSEDWFIILHSKQGRKIGLQIILHTKQDYNIGLQIILHTNR